MHPLSVGRGALRRGAVVVSVLVVAVGALPAAAAALPVAYLDPGTGAVLLQTLLAMFMGAVVAIGVWWNKFKSFVARLFGRGGLPKDDE